MTITYICTSAAATAPLTSTLSQYRALTNNIHHPQEETRELTKPDGEPDGDAPPPPPKNKEEVVYAQLLHNSDGAKTEVRPSADKTEYAVIVGTKPEADVAANDDNKTKE